MTLKFNPVTEQFDEEDLHAFIKDKEVLSAREHFFIKQETPYLVVFLTYLPGTGDQPKAPGGAKAESWRELLTDAQLPLFNTLREWRSERAKQEGVPPYIICTNQQLAQMVAARPESLAGLGNIQGFGKAKSEKYGKELLALLRPQAAKKETVSSDQPPLFRDVSPAPAGQTSSAEQATTPS